MDIVNLNCPNCGGVLEFRIGAEYGFCMYCGSKVLIPKPERQNSLMISDSTKFFLLIYSKGVQTQNAIKDSVRMELKYRDNAVSGDPRPLGITVMTSGQEIQNKFKIGGTGTGVLEISGIGKNLTLTKDQKIKASINGQQMTTNSTRLWYGDLVSIDQLIFRIQPMPDEQ